MKDKIFKYFEYIKEDNGDALNLTPQTYVETALRNLEQRLRSMFEIDKAEDGKVKRFGEIKDKDRRDKGELSFKDLGLELQSLELSKYSKVFDNVKLKFNDEEFLYDITFTINMKDAVPQDASKDFDDSQIENCQVIFKKYDLDNFNLVLGPKNKTVKLKDIDEEFLVKLKVEFEEGTSQKEDEFKIETEEKPQE